MDSLAKLMPNQRLFVLGSWFLVLGSWFLVLGSWFLVLGSWFANVKAPSSTKN
jgi:hypothetical protein